MDPGVNLWTQALLERVIHMPFEWSFFLPNANPDKLIYTCYCSAWDYLILIGVSFENTKYYILESFEMMLLAIWQSSKP